MKKLIILLALCASISCAENMSSALARGCTPVLLPPGQSLDGLLTQSGAVLTNDTRYLAALTNAAAFDPAGTAGVVQVNLGTHADFTLAGGAHGGLPTPAAIGAVSNTPAVIAAAGGMTNGGSYSVTLTGGNAVTNGAIPGPGCKNFGASQDLTLDGLTVAYAARPSGVYTINVSRAASAGYCYVLTTYSTNSYVLDTKLVRFGTHTIGATNRFGFSPDTNGTYQVQQMRIQ
jgi:hypothetical protein